MSKKAISSAAAPAAIGTYSQAIQVGGLVFLSGQIPLDPATMEVVEGDFSARARRVFDNLSAVAKAAGGDLNQTVKLPSMPSWKSTLTNHIRRVRQSASRHCRKAPTSRRMQFS